MNKREKILFIKYVLNSIKYYEENLENINSDYELLKNEIAILTDNLNLRISHLTDLLPIDSTINSLANRELQTINLYMHENQKDKELVLKLLDDINLEESIEVIKQKIINILEEKKSKNLYYFQLSETLHACLIS